MSVIEAEDRFLLKTVNDIDVAIDQLTYMNYIYNRDRGMTAEGLAKLLPNGDEMEVCYQRLLSV